MAPSDRPGGSLCTTDVHPSDLGSRSRVHMHHGPQDAEDTPRTHTARRGLRGTALCGFGWPQIVSQRLLGVTARRGLRGTALCGFGWPDCIPPSTRGHGQKTARGTALCGFRWPQIASHRLLGVKRSATGQAVLFRRHQPRD